MGKSVQAATLILLISACMGCSAATRNFSEARDLEEQGRLEEAMFRYAEASRLEPEHTDYRLSFLRTRQVAADARAKRGDTLLEQGHYTDAMAEFQTAAGLDPSQSLYRQKASEASTRLDAENAYKEGKDFEINNKLREALSAYTRAFELQPKRTDYQKSVQRVLELRQNSPKGAELQLRSSQPITLSFRDARLKDVFRMITQLSGINFIFDEGVKDQNVTITLEKATFYQTLELLTGMHKLGRKTLNETTVILYPLTSEKVKQYEELIMRTYHLNHLDAKKAINLVRSMLQIKKIFANEEGNTLIVRDTENVVAVVEKLLEANDVPEAEVVLDIEVLEINDKNSKNLGLLLSSYSVSLGGYSPAGKFLSPSLFADTTAPAPIDVSQLIKAFNIKGFGGYVTLPNATYNFGKNLSRGEVLSNPKLRVKNKEKAKFNVGQRVPIQTSTTVNTTTSFNVQYVDVGVKVNVEPIIQLNNEINIKLNMEVSSVINKETAKDGTTLVTIGTRNLETVLSLKDGETSIIGGLIQHGSSDDKVKVFILGDLPLIGPLLSNNKSEKSKSELMLAVTPRLVRSVTVPSRSHISFISGREDDPTLKAPYKSFDQDTEQLNRQPSPISLKQPTGTITKVPPTTEQPLSIPVPPLKQPVASAPSGISSTIPTAGQATMPVITTPDAARQSTKATTP